MHTTSSAATPTGGRIALALAAVYVIWGSTYLGIRFLIAGGLMYAFLRWRGVPAPTRPQWRNASVMGLLLMLFGNGMVNLAEQTVSSGMTAVAVASAPLWIGIFSAMRGDKPGRMEWVGIAIGFLGVLWLNADSSLTASPVGLVALLIASLSWSFGSVWSRGRDLPSPFMSSAAQMLCGGVAMCIVGAAVGERFDGMPSAHGMAAFAYLIVFGSIIGFSSYIWLLHHVRPALASSYAYINPAIAVALGAWLAGERFGSHELVAMGVILLGVVAITFAKTAKAAKPKPA